MYILYVFYTIQMFKRMNQDANSQAARKCAQLGAQLTSESTVCRETQGKGGWPVETTGHTIVFVCKLDGLYSDLIWSTGEWTPLTLKYPTLMYFDYRPCDFEM